MSVSLESVDVRMLNVGYAWHDGDWNWKNVCSPITRIYYVTEGEATIRLPEKSVRLRPDHLYIIPANTVHSYECDGPFAHYYLHAFTSSEGYINLFNYYDLPTEVPAEHMDKEIFMHMCQRHPEAKLPSSDPSSYEEGDLFESYVRRYSEMPLHEKALLKGLVFILLSRFLKQATYRSSVMDKRIEKALEYIDRNICNEINLDILSNLSCVTKPYFIRLFKAALDTTPMQYINKKKVEKAQLLLITTDKTVQEVSYVIGILDHSYFIRLFKKVCGVTPQEYRNRMKRVMSGV
ncbi:MAG: AraC family transcriptional regulator [Bacteroidaceae bacterium]|nr:AraC family transcriptional regulator [Bacteroidaceae bacterium]